MCKCGWADDWSAFACCVSSVAQADRVPICIANDEYSTRQLLPRQKDCLLVRWPTVFFCFFLLSFFALFYCVCFCRIRRYGTLFSTAYTHEYIYTSRVLQESPIGMVFMCLRKLCTLFVYFFIYFSLGQLLRPRCPLGRLVRSLVLAVSRRPRTTPLRVQLVPRPQGQCSTRIAASVGASWWAKGTTTTAESRHESPRPSA